jgi:hypothetical protein
MTTPTATRHYWIFIADPHHYHWDTLFVKGKEMWHGAGSRPDAIRALKQVRKGDRVALLPLRHPSDRCIRLRKSRAIPILTRTTARARTGG